jgi:hypothetical protein
VPNAPVPLDARVVRHVPDRIWLRRVHSPIGLPRRWIERDRCHFVLDLIQDRRQQFEGLVVGVRMLRVPKPFEEDFQARLLWDVHGNLLFCHQIIPHKEYSVYGMEASQHPP